MDVVTNPGADHGLHNVESLNFKPQIRCNSLTNYVLCCDRHALQFQIDQTVGRHNAVFVLHVLARANIDSATGIFNQEPAGGDVPQADSRFNVCVESSAGDICHIQSSAAEHAAFAYPMNHLLKQRE